MKTDIHPTYNEKVTITCSCGSTLVVGSTSETLTTEVCSACHPFYTGKQKLVDVAGRVDKFRHRQEEAKKRATATKTKSAKKADKKPTSKKKKTEKVTKLG